MYSCKKVKEKYLKMKNMDIKVKSLTENFMFCKITESKTNYEKSEDSYNSNYEVFKI